MCVPFNSAHVGGSLWLSDGSGSKWDRSICRQELHGVTYMWTRYIALSCIAGVTAWLFSPFVLHQVNHLPIMQCNQCEGLCSCGLSVLTDGAVPSKSGGVGLVYAFCAPMKHGRFPALRIPIGEKRVRATKASTEASDL